MYSGGLIMNKKLLVLAGIMSVLSINVMAEADMRTIVGSLNNITVDETENENGQKSYTVGLSEDVQGLRSIEVSDDPAGRDKYVEINGNEIKVSHNDGVKHSSLTLDGLVVESDTDQINRTTYGPNGIVIEKADGDNNPVTIVSLTDNGLNNGNHKIVNVSKGEVSKTSTDAINGSQLHEVKTQVDNNTNRISTLENNTANIGDKVLNNAKSYTDQQVSRVGAASAALAGLHYLDYNPNDKWSFATSLGHYKHSTAGAIGASYQPNENSMVHAGVTLGGESMFNIGASFKVGEQDPTLKTSRFEMAKQIKDLQADNASLRADNEELRAEVNEIKAALKKLQ